MDLYRPLFVKILVLSLVLFPCDSEVRTNLTAVVGSSVRFPDPVKERAFLNFGPKLIASVSNGVFEIEEDVYRNRLHWDDTGHFCLSDLQKYDSGVYSIDSKKGNVFSKYYELKLYDPLSAPDVSCVNVSVDRCSLQCSVSESDQTKLSWFREGQSVVSSRSGFLLITVGREDYNQTYKCVAQNPADNKTTTVTIDTVCEINETQSTGDKSGTSNYVIVYIFIAVAIIVLLLCLGIYKWTQRSKMASTTFPTQDSVQYAQINFQQRKDNQSVNAPDASFPARSDLTTVYDKVEKHRMRPIYNNFEVEVT